MVFVVCFFKMTLQLLLLLCHRYLMVLLLGVLSFILNCCSISMRNEKHENRFEPQQPHIQFTIAYRLCIYFLYVVCIGFAEVYLFGVCKAKRHSKWPNATMYLYSPVCVYIYFIVLIRSFHYTLSHSVTVTHFVCWVRAPSTPIKCVTIPSVRKILISFSLTLFQSLAVLYIEKCCTKRIVAWVMKFTEKNWYPTKWKKTPKFSFFWSPKYSSDIFNNIVSLSP